MSANIVLLPGDGVGPEVVDAARAVLQAVAARFSRPLHFSTHAMGGYAIDAYGTPLPDETLDACQRADAVLLGAVGGPKWSDPTAPVRPEQGLLKLRKSLGLYANLRPVRVFPALAGASPLRREIVSRVDMLVVRELTGGIYFGESGRCVTELGPAAYDTMIYSESEVERVTRLAARLAAGRRGHVTSVDKANVLESSRLWRSTVSRVMAGEFPNVAVEHVLVDAAAMFLIKQPARFDVVVTGNMFGDILTDEASVLAGSLGLLPSASLGDGSRGLYEPIHGSAPDIAGQGIANPIGTILSAALLCRYSLGWEDAARCIEAAVEQTLADGLRTADLADADSKPAGTVALTEEISERVRWIDLPASSEGARCAVT